MYSLIAMAENYVDYDFECCLNPIPEIGRNLCRISLRKEGHGGYKEDFLTENLSKREKTILMCKTCDGLIETRRDAMTKHLSEDCKEKELSVRLLSTSV